MAGEESINLLSLEIMPLSKNMLKKGVFAVDDPEFKHLIDFYKTAAWHAQEEKKSKTYIARYNNEVIAYISISIGLFAIDEVKSTTYFKSQALIIGKIYVLPEYRSYGVGKHLLDFATDIAVRVDMMTGCSGIVVDSNSNPSTLGFYKNFGFKEIEREDKEQRTVRMFFRLPTV